MEQSPSWEGNRFSASQEVLHILWNPKVHYRIRQCPPPVPVNISTGPRLSLWIFRNNTHFYGVKLLAPRKKPKLEDHPLSAVRDCLFNIFAATFYIGGRSSIRNLRTRHAVVTGTHSSRNIMSRLTKLGALLTWHLGFVHPWCSVWSLITIKPKLKNRSNQVNHIVWIRHANDQDMATVLSHAGGSLWNRKSCRLCERRKNWF